MPAHPPATQHGPTQPGAVPGGQPRPAQPGTARRASGRGENSRSRAGAQESRGSRQPQAPRDAREPRGLGRWGSLPAGFGVGIIAASAVLGAGATVVTRTAPGLVLGASVVGGTVVAALAVRPRAGRVIVPAPVLIYLVAALTAGIIYNRSAASSNTALAVDAAQWAANGFFAMALATVLAVVLAGVRWYIWRRGRPVPVAPGRSAPVAGAEELGGAGVRRDLRGSEGWDHPGPPAPQPPHRLQGPDARPGPRPQQRPGWPADQRPRGPGSGPYNFSSGA